MHQFLTQPVVFRPITRNPPDYTENGFAPYGRNACRSTDELHYHRLNPTCVDSRLSKDSLSTPHWSVLSGRRPGSFLSCLGQGCSGGIRTHGLRVMSPASDQTALRCDKNESTKLLQPDKSFTISGGFEHPSIQQLSRFLPSPHALRLLTG